MRRLWLLIAFAIGLTTAAQAQTSFTFKDAAGVTQTSKSFNCSSNICPLAVPGDTTGAAFGVTANPFFISFASGVALPAGTALLGKVGIDQTTPGTTNLVATSNWPTTVDTNSGSKSASTPRFVIATDQPNLTTPLNVANKAAFGVAQLSSAPFTANSAGDNTVVTRLTGTIKVYGMEFSCASAQTSITVKNGAGATIGGPYYNVGTYSRTPASEPAFVTTSTNNFIINMAGAVNCGGTVYYLDN